MNLFRSIQAKWSLLGIAFGCLFPIVGTLFEIYFLDLSFSWENIIFTQSSQPAIWIVDLAPIVLGIVFSIIGYRDKKMMLLNQNIAQKNKELGELQEHLEQLVKERTEEIERAHKKIARRAEQFESITQVSRAISTIQEQVDLLPSITHLISSHLGYYHVGIFLLDENKQLAILRTANSEGGKRMLARKHRLRVEQTSIVGYVTSTGNPRIALDTGTDDVYFDNPDLPETRSEIALPLISGKQVIGALDVQSTEPNAFTQEDIDILLALADQVSAALENARLHEESQESLARAEIAYRQLTGETWSNYQRSATVVGYRFNGIKAEPLDRSANEKNIKRLQDAHSVPLQLHGKSIGALRIKSANGEHMWTEDEIAIIQATAERVALAAENARLVEESQKRASKEKIIGEVTAKIGSSVQLRNVLQTAVEELGRNIPGSEIVLQLASENKIKMETENENLF